jgi:hypothetical protein
MEYIYERNALEAASGGEGQEMRKFGIVFALFVLVFGQLSQRVFS